MGVPGVNMIKNMRTEYLHKQYLETYRLNRYPYEAWQKKKEKKNLRSEALDEEYVILSAGEIVSEPWSETAFNRCIREKDRPDIIYADEDYIDETGDRSHPFFKPCWSPDTFLSFNYMGHYVCVRKEALDKTIDRVSIGDSVLTDENRLYDRLLQMIAQGAKVEHVPEVLFHKRFVNRQPDGRLLYDKNTYYEMLMQYEETKPLGDVFRESEDVKAVKEAFLVQTGRVGEISYDKFSGCYRACYKVTGNAKVSVVIPSKDHYEILRTCVDSLTSLTAYPNYEIVVVDNGSSDANREKIEKYLAEHGAKYIYKPMNFNFSTMCNIGAQESEGDYIVFLNDDVEVLHAEWMERMLGQAMLPHIGAVGAKLLYPGREKLQHIGALVLKPGPAHMLPAWPDDRDFYYHRNYLEHDYSIVTAACLMVSREKFEQAGRFDEQMPVNYNDVDLTLRLVALGYYNVARMDAVLCHHESLSRGNDAVRRQTRERLGREKEFLYGKHPGYRTADPFYNVNLSPNRATFEVDGDYEYEDMSVLSKAAKALNYASMPESEALQSMMDKAVYTDGIVHIEGWSYVMSADNAFYKRFLVLEDVAKKAPVITVELWDKYRVDVEKNFPDENNIGLAGYVCHVSQTALKPDTRYRVGILAAAKLSRQRLFRFSDSILDTSGQL